MDMAPYPAGVTTLADIPETMLVERYGTTRAEVEAVKKALAPEGTTDFEMLLYLGLCKRLGLDPFVPGLVHFMRFQNREKTGYRTGIVLGVYGYLQMAQQQKDCDGIAVQCYPENVDAPPTHAKCTVWKKGWSHPLEVTVSFKEKKPKKFSPFWEDSPRQALETAAIRRGCRLAWPSLFAPLDDEDVDESIPPGARGPVGTALGEHHDASGAPVPRTPAIDVEARPAPPFASGTTSGPTISTGGTPKPPIEPGGELLPGSDPRVETLKADIADFLSKNYDTPLGMNARNLLKARLTSRGLSKLSDAGPSDADLLETLATDLDQMARQA